MKQENNNQKRLGNKGFSLVELIIVMAIMAILVGVVGTQAIPYMNKAREAKDYQVISSYATAAMTAYTSNVSTFGSVAKEFKLYTTDNTSTDEVVKMIKTLTYADLSKLKAALKSTEGGNITDIVVNIDPPNRNIKITVTGSSSGVFAVIDNPM